MSTNEKAVTIESVEEIDGALTAVFSPDDETFNPHPPIKELIVNPTSATIKAYAPNGFDVFITIRAWDTGELLNRVNNAVTWLDEKGWSPNDYAPRRAAQEPAPQSQAASNGGTQQAAPQDPAYCAVHGVAMKRREKHGEVWYSHQAHGPDGQEYWCRGGQ